LSRHGKKGIERGALTLWRQQRKGLVRTQKDTDRARGTHFLEMEDEGPCQDIELARTRQSERHSLSGDDRGMGFSGLGKKIDERRALTTWRWQREGYVRK
jgi:hypothetical protein